MTAATRDAILQDLLDLDRLARYYSLLSNRYHTRYRQIQWAMLAATLIGFASLTWSALAWIAPFVFASAVVFEHQDRTRERSVISDVLAQQYKLALSDWSALWEDMAADAMSEAEILAKKRELKSRVLTTMGGLDDRLGLGAYGDEELNDRAMSEAETAVEDRYAAV